MAISSKYRKTLIHQQFIADLAEDTANDIYDTQIAIARNMKSKSLYNYLKTKPYSITKTNHGVTMTLNYRTSVRFADIRWDVNGKKKDNYNPIYNKIVFGYVYSFMYKQLIAGVGRGLNEAIEQRLINSGLIPSN